jgi:hypothetical protein
MKNPIYPILVIEIDENRIYAFSKSRDFSFVDEELAEKLGFEGLRVIDSSGNEFRIKSFEKIGWGTIFGGYSLLTKGRQIKLEFDFEYLNKIHLTDFKELTKRIVKNGKERIELPEGSTGLLKAIEEAETTQQIISLFY